MEIPAAVIAFAGLAFVFAGLAFSFRDSKDGGATKAQGGGLGALWVGSREKVVTVVMQISDIAHRRPPFQLLILLLRGVSNWTTAPDKAMRGRWIMVLTLLMIFWGAVTAVLTILVVYRGTLSIKEDDQIFLDPAEQHHFREQQVVIAKLSRLKTPIIAFSVISGVLLLTSVGIWIYRGLQNF